MLVVTNSHHFTAIVVSGPSLTAEQLNTFTSYLEEVEEWENEEGFDQ